MFDADDFRLQVHKKYSANSLVDWILDVIKPKKGWSVLDIGCGNGEQLLPITQRIGRGGYAVGIDLSKDAIQSLREKARRLRIENVTPVVGDMDKFERYVPSGLRYDLGISNFAIYYAKDVGKLFAKARARLKDTGFLFLTGPARHNNHALLQLHESIGGTFPSHYDPDEMEVRIMDALKNEFDRTETSLFWNPVTFPSAEVLTKYWKFYFVYDPKLASEFASAARRHFREHDTFVTVKEVIGIKAYKE